LVTFSFSRTNLQQLRTSYHATTNDSDLLENYSEDNRDAKQIQTNGQAGIDYHLNKKTIVGALFSANYRKWTMESLNDAFVTNNHETDTVIDIVNNELHTTVYYGANLNLQHDFSRMKSSRSMAIIFITRTKIRVPYLNNYYDGAGNFLFKENVESNKLTPLHFWIVAADYTKKLSKNLDLEAGLKGTTSGLEDGIQVASLTRTEWVTDTTLTGSHRLNESIAAAYASFSMKFSDKTSAKAGLRYEYSETSIESLTHGEKINRYFSEWFPSVFFLHAFNENNSLNFTYSRRIYRPSYSDFAPYVIFQDPKTFQTGNPSLQPGFIDNVSLSYTYKNKIISLSYSYLNPTIVQQPHVDKLSNRMVTASANANSNEDVSVSLALPFTVTKWWSMQNNFYLNWTQFNGFYEHPEKTENMNLFFNGAQNFTLPKNYSFSVSGYYSSGFTWGNYVFKSVGSIDAGVQKKFKNRSSLSLNITNIVSSFNVMRMSGDVPAQDLIIRNKNTNSHTGVNLSFTHNFGSDKVLQKRERTTGDEDEKSRAY
jgi:outer membrane receptor protein involved in Fe transport